MGLFDVALTWLKEAFPGKPTWSAEELPNLEGRVFFVTGGNSGIGKETVRVLLLKGAKVYIGSRSPGKTAVAVDELKAATGTSDSRLIVIEQDLTDLRSIKRSVETFLAKETRLYGLINNAGLISFGDKFTKDGVDLQFGTNVLGHFYLTQLLLPTLIASAKTAPDHLSRVVHLSSVAHLFSPPGGIDYRALTSGPERPVFSDSALYGQSKAGNILVSNELARRYGDKGIVSISLSPGNIQSDLLRETPKAIAWVMSWILFDVKTGALSSLFAAASPEAVTLNGKYLVPWAREASPREDLLDSTQQEKLWDWLETKVKELA